MKKIIMTTLSVMALSSTAVLADAAGNWGYEGDTGPAKWGSLSKEFSVCDTGRLQSPFDIKANFETSLPALSFNYSAAPLDVTRGAHGVTVAIPAGQTMTVGDDVYDLLQYHFHTPSEYHINGKSFPMSLHLVHKRKSDGALGVLGVMIEAGAANAAIEKIWSKLPAKAGNVASADVSINPADLLPDTHSYMRFSGSLTTPPCSEGVNWHMLEKPITMSAKQIGAFRAIAKMNARPLQPANNRLVVGE